MMSLRSPIRHLYVASALWLMLLVCGLYSAPAMAQQAQPHEFVLPGYYRLPDQEPFTLRSWLDGWSVSVDWQPQVHYSNVSLNGVEMANFGVSLTKDFNKTNALRFGFSYASKRLGIAADYQWNLSNYYNGYSASRQWEWLFTAGGMAGFVQVSDPEHPHYHGTTQPWAGGQLGLQLRHTLSPYVSLYVEPQYHLATMWYDGHLSPQNVVDDAVSMRIGLITRIAPPLRTDAYGHSAHLAGLWLRDLGMHFVLPDGLMVNRHHGLQRLYSQLLGGVQVAAAHGPYLSPLSVEAGVGLQLNTVYGLQAGVYQQQMSYHLAHSQRGDVQQGFGLRLEATANLLRGLWPESYDYGWSFSLSGGFEAGRLQLWQHASHPVYHHYGPTAAAQLRRRLSGPLWLVLQGRMQWVDVDSEHHQSSLQLGVHYDMSSRRSSALMPRGPEWYNNLSVQVAAGWWDARNLFFTGSLLYDFTPVHAMRGDLSFSRADVSSGPVPQVDWQAASLDYVANLSNAALGYDPSRHFNLFFLAGYHLSGHKVNDLAPIVYHLGSYIGIETGMQMELRLNHRLAFYVEHKALFQPFDTQISPRSQEAWHMQGTAGIKVHL